MPVLAENARNVFSGARADKKEKEAAKMPILVGKHL